ncbi:MAG: hypothetical protein RMK01_03955 [Thermomicrobium sp.]|nr:hypothetical protein [Thermomicrobium sp.]
MPEQPSSQDIAHGEVAAGVHPRACRSTPAPGSELDAPDPEALRIGLSYVLHEPSFSSTVLAHVRAVLAGYQRAWRALRALARLDDEELLTRIVVRDEDAIDRLQREASPSVLSLQLGASPLLARVLALVSPTGAAEPVIRWLDRPLERTPSHSIPAFRTELRLALPPEDGSAPWLAVVVFRPGWTSLLLDVVPLGGDDVVAYLGRALERVLREYTDQWWARERWWDRPAEEVYPELREGTR